MKILGSCNLIVSEMSVDLASLPYIRPEKNQNAYSCKK